MARPAFYSSEARNGPITRVMRVFGLVAMVCSLAIVGALMMLSMSHNGPTSNNTKLAKAEATAAVGSLNFTAAATELEGYKAENATYAGAVLPPAFGVTVMRADTVLVTRVDTVTRTKPAPAARGTAPR